MLRNQNLLPTREMTRTRIFGPLFSRKPSLLFGRHDELFENNTTVSEVSGSVMGREQSAVEGRAGAWETMRTALRSSAQQGRLVVVRGPAGIGKTWLLEELGRRWRNQGVRIAQVRGTGR